MEVKEVELLELEAASVEMAELEDRFMEVAAVANDRGVVLSQIASELAVLRREVRKARPASVPELTQRLLRVERLARGDRPRRLAVVH